MKILVNSREYPTECQEKNFSEGDTLMDIMTIGNNPAVKAEYTEAEISIITRYIKAIDSNITAALSNGDLSKAKKDTVINCFVEYKDDCEKAILEHSMTDELIINTLFKDCVEYLAEERWTNSMFLSSPINYGTVEFKASRWMRDKTKSLLKRIKIFKGRVKRQQIRLDCERHNYQHYQQGAPCELKIKGVGYYPIDADFSLSIAEYYDVEYRHLLKTSQRQLDLISKVDINKAVEIVESVRDEKDKTVTYIDSDGNPYPAENFAGILNTEALQKLHELVNEITGEFLQHADNSQEADDKLQDAASETPASVNRKESTMKNITTDAAGIADNAPKIDAAIKLPARQKPPLKSILRLLQLTRSPS